MRGRKGAVDIISAVLIVILGISLVGSALAWGLPLVQKKTDTALVDRVSVGFDQGSQNSLPSVIENVANTGGRSAFGMDVEGAWLLYPCAERNALGDYIQGCGDPSYTDPLYISQNNSIEFNFLSKVSNFATDGSWISLSSAPCVDPPQGRLGLDKASVVCAKATPKGGLFSITYKVWFRELVDDSGRNVYKINLMKDPASATTSTRGTVVATLADKRQISESGKNLIITDLNILLV